MPHIVRPHDAPASRPSVKTLDRMDDDTNRRITAWMGFVQNAKGDWTKGTPGQEDYWYHVGSLRYTRDLNVMALAETEIRARRWTDEYAEILADLSDVHPICANPRTRARALVQLLERKGVGA